jgi:hypothetical protein
MFKQVCLHGFITLPASNVIFLAQVNSRAASLEEQLKAQAAIEEELKQEVVQMKAMQEEVQVGLPLRLPVARGTWNVVLTTVIQALRAKGQEVKTLEAEIEQLRKRNARKSAMLTKGYVLLSSSCFYFLFSSSFPSRSEAHLSSSGHLMPSQWPNGHDDGNEL